MAEIIVKFDDKVIERVVTEKKRISIGRTNDNDIVLENRGVSRKHAIIEFNNNAAVIMDNESLNGTFVNNRKISEEVLRDEDTITIGKYTLVYHTESKATDDKMTAMDGTMVTSYETPATSVAPLSLFTATNPEIAEEVYINKFEQYLHNQNWAENDQNYYDHNWIWFGIAMYHGKLDNYWD